VIAAHPDDEILGCGGTMARHAENGDDVHIVILGEGITARARMRNVSKDQRALETLHADARRAASIVGAKTIRTHPLPDNRFDSIPLLDIIKVVEAEKRRTSPSIVYTHHGNDLNIDHRRVADAVQTAFRPLPGEKPCTLMAFEVSSSTEYQSALAGDPFRPTVYVDISKFLDHKCRAMTAYRSEARAYPHPRSAEAIRAIAIRAGLEVGLGACERFALVRQIQGDEASDD